MFNSIIVHVTVTASKVGNKAKCMMQSGAVEAFTLRESNSSLYFAFDIYIQFLHFMG